MLLAARAAPLCLVMVVVTSIKAARRRLRYESWHLLHLYAYLGVGLALPHQLWTGQQFLALAGRDRVLVDRVGGRRRRRPGLAGRRCRCGATLRHGCASLGRPRGATAWCRSTSPAGDLDAAAASRPGSSSPGASWPGRAGRARTPTRCPRRPTAAACGSPSRRSATAAATCPRSGAAPGCSSRAPTAGSAPGPAPGDKVALIGAGVGITPLRALAEGLHSRRATRSSLHRYSRRPLFRRELEVLARERG